MKRNIFTAAALCFVSVNAFSQHSNLNPTVQVTNEYKNKVQETDKTSLPTVIPDSLYKFDLNFDYVGFENPYKGVKGFNPYRTELDLAPQVRQFKKFYLKGGAGYELSPELEMVWTFNPEAVFKSGVFVDHKSFFGDYFSMAGPRYHGYDSYTNAGYQGRVDFKKANMVISAAYEGVHASNDSQMTNNFNSAVAGLSLNSNLDPEESRLKYGLHALYSFGCPGSTYDHDASVSGFMDFIIDNQIVELGAQYSLSSASSVYDGKPECSGWALAVRPRYVLLRKNMSLSAGVTVLGNDVSQMRRILYLGKSSWGIWPGIDFLWHTIPDYLDFFFRTDMEASVYGARENILNNIVRVVPENGYAITGREYALLGLRGNIAGKVHYSISGSFEDHNNMPVFGISTFGLLEYDDSWNPTLLFTSLKDIYAEAELSCDFGPVSLDGHVRYTDYYLLQKETPEIVPSAWNAGACLKYNYADRIRFHVGADYRSEYKADINYTVPYIIDLYAGLSYMISKKFGIYVNGRNLLNRRCEYIPMYARGGITVTGGILLNM